ncbi:hypothetical protein [Streptomyces noursei]|uniref:hypothetical protein n=1 Tax=Streptomyces noursei TaxID=1971 RepID=UPI00196627F6|nr:hypothetical protein [Streptomyces noursei]QRX95761.1 hypothetical protein JNO44_37700 [Streptomyces noursei]
MTPMAPEPCYRDENMSKPDAVPEPVRDRLSYPAALAACGLVGEALLVDVGEGHRSVALSRLAASRQRW